MAQTKNRPPVRAAGAVLWRPGEDAGEPLLALIHRPRYDDWSIPREDRPPGETGTRCRRSRNLRGFGQRADLGRRLSRITYLVPVGTKIVDTGARAKGGDSTPSKEDEMVWLPPGEATKQLTIRTTARCWRSSPRSPPTPRPC